VAGVTRDDMLAAIAAAVACGDSAVKHISAWKDALFEVPSAHSRGIPTGWSLLDNLLGGLRQGEVTLLTADTGAGKTTWAVDLARRHADKGHAVLIASLEIGTKAISRKLLSSVAGALWDKLDTDSRTFAVNRLCDMPIYLLDRYGDVEVARLKDEMRFAVRRYGVTLVVIDHLHFALGVRKPGEDERLLIDATAHTIQTTALELGIHVLLVMHPAKIRANEDGKTRPPEIGDLKGSSGPAQFADNVVRVVRDPTQPRTALTLLKVRSELGRPGRVIFGFDPNSLRFTDLTAHADNEPPPSKGPRDFRKDSAGDKEDE
jgi:replicative DNA helicase